MPFVKHQGKIIFFAHVPKCAGTSVEKFLSTHIGELNFRDGRWWKIETPRWNNSSPQHIETDALGRLFAPSFFDAVFTVVRHPAKRFMSAFNQRYLAKQLPDSAATCKTFLEALATREDFFGQQFDNHFVPATRIVPQKAKVFRLEDGLDPIITYFRNQHGLNAPDAIIPHSNKRDYKKAQKKSLTLTPEIEDMVYELYQADYERFGYEKITRPAAEQASHALG